MKVAIIYSTRHGTTEKVARLIAEKLGKHEVTCYDLHLTSAPLLEQYHRVIIGGSIHFGAIQKNVQKFCARHLDQLLQKEVGLFICCLDPEKEEQQLKQAFPEVLLKHSKAQGYMGGELNLEKMNWLERMIIKLVGKTKQSFSRIHYSAIDHFVNQMEQPIGEEKLEHHH